MIRPQHNRSLGKRRKLWDEVTAQPPLGTLRSTLNARPGQPARLVEQQVWTHRLEIAPNLHVTCVVARESNPPPGVKSLEWRLLSNREGSDFAAASQLIDWYRARWEIELLFHPRCRVSCV